MKNSAKGLKLFSAREHYLKERKIQFDYKNVYKKLTGDVENPLEKINKTVLKKVRDRRNNTLDYFLVNKFNLGRFYLLLKNIRYFEMCQDDPLYPVQSIIQKIFLLSLSFTLNFWDQKLNLISRTRMIFLGK